LPYKSIDELPDSVSAIPKHAKEIFMAAVNSAYSSTCKDKGDKQEQCAMQVGWAAVKNRYEQDKDGNWQEKKETKSTCPQKEVILSSIPIFKDNDLIIPFVRDGTKAFGKDGKEYIITSEALDKDFKSYENGHITANHKKLETGRIAEVWREKPFVYGRITGLTDELREMILSKAYKGVSQESEGVSINDKGEVTRLKGKGTTIVFYPDVPACDTSQGCGVLPIVSTITDTENFSLYSFGQNIESVIKGDTTTEYSKEQIKSMLKAMMDAPDMVDESMRKMMRTMMGDTTKSTIEGNMTEDKQPETKPESDALLKSTIADFEALKKENEVLKSTITKLTEESAKLKADIPAMLESTLKAHDAQIKADLEYAEAAKELHSIMRNEEAAKEFMAIKPGIDVIKSTITMLRKTNPATPPGVGNGTEVLNSTIDGKPFDYSKERTEFYSSIGR
jgi:cation transport regulator ChaB